MRRPNKALMQTAKTGAATQPIAGLGRFATLHSVT